MYIFIMSDSIFNQLSDREAERSSIACLIYVNIDRIFGVGISRPNS